AVRAGWPAELSWSRAAPGESARPQRSGSQRRAQGSESRAVTSRAEQAGVDIRAASGNPAVDVFAADMSSQAEVRQLAAAVLDAYPRLDVLVNNVGGFWHTDSRPPTAWSAPSPSTTSPHSCSPTCFWIGSRPARP